VVVETEDDSKDEKSGEFWPPGMLKNNCSGAPTPRHDQRGLCGVLVLRPRRSRCKCYYLPICIIAKVLKQC